MTIIKPYTQALPNGFSFDLISVGAGSFMMGSEDKEAFNSEKPVHRVYFDYDFLIGKYPVTQALWKAVMGPENNPSHFKGDRRPVEQVSWYDAAAFCNALNEMCGYSPCYFEDPAFRTLYGEPDEGYAHSNEGPVYLNPAVPGYRLPTEAEWEYAARGGMAGSATKYVGSNLLDETGWYDGNSHDETKPVGLKMPNELGICDMSGNVLEWCEDQLHDSYENAPGNGSAWTDRKQGSSRVLRGGSWDFIALLCRSTNRFNNTPADRINIIGFRLVLSALPV
jgi:formylglycine-generating enzyme required for sulfatase activity